MSVIVAYGDSNTWGYDPAAGARFAPGVRWTGIMQSELGASFKVIEEGLNGRTTVFDDPIEPYRNGLAYLPPCLLSHAPLDLIIISLGCNDLKRRFWLSASDIAQGVERLVLTAKSFPVGRNGGPPDIILAAPPPVVELTAFADMFEGAREKSRELGARYRAVAKLHGVGFVDAGEHIHCSPLDGIHFEADQHARLGRVMAATVRERLG
ncbi:SGNH/GDSL hydrolase family protein [Methylocapsa sp. S129]|uniref:SGNH/GDSL hydrolase family protein n=1 Tax=Methylocapsa sp. S129 TaxID=1641869 RepID=UPI00131BF9A9|nr:SGNH/GDSL hydrolase family protein [Methylocapsa sp. S129]